MTIPPTACGGLQPAPDRRRSQRTGEAGSAVRAWSIAALVPILAEQTPLTLLALLLVPATAWLLLRTPLGLARRAAVPQALMKPWRRGER